MMVRKHLVDELHEQGWHLITTREWYEMQARMAEVEPLREALQTVRDERLPDLYPDKQDMPKNLEHAYELGYVHALESVFQIARQALGEA